ncbi:MAG: hypothetical protein QF724_05570 [Planctomycetota bacterium]|jgi:hypothetical protein|nr:hypothetical protein [Planctomycetota bacterium]MDP6838389.1 hypothetical protein [Planctomycetota bacterium]MDP6955141.1 hypothetical protein [Planctomycetota bacterium]
MKRCHLDKIASVTWRLGLHPNAVLGTQIPARAGTIVAARVLRAETVYDTLEDVHGRRVRLYPGDVIAGALGQRDALHGFSGRVPTQVSVGDQLQLLNAGGVLGTGAERHPALGEPFTVEVLGSILAFPGLDRSDGRPARVEDGALEHLPLPATCPPVLALVGTSMDSGKTTAASVIISELTRRGLSVAAGKLTGVSLRRDILAMADCGAAPVSLFTDFGVVTTTPHNAVESGRALLAHLADSDPDVIVLEMGDGLLGTYGVHSLLEDAAFRAKLTAITLCAVDPVGAWGATQLMEQRYGLRPTAVTGPVTDTPVGRGYCQEQLGLSAANALGQAGELIGALLPSLGFESGEPHSIVEADRGAKTAATPEPIGAAHPVGMA